MGQAKNTLYKEVSCFYSEFKRRSSMIRQSSAHLW
jgi:hypothetical protein